MTVKDSMYTQAETCSNRTRPSVRPSRLHRIGTWLVLAVVIPGSPWLSAREDPSAAAAPSPAAADTATTAADDDTVTGPGSAVHRLHSTLLEVMKNAGELGYRGRYETLSPVIKSVFDTPLISRVILSRYWKDLSETEQSEFIDMFTRLSIATYASRFDGYNGEAFTETGVKELQKGRQLVQTELQRKDKKAVTLDYLVHRNNGKWQIISVIADGVNDLSLKRAEYAVVIKDKGYDGLLEDIQSKIENMESGS